MRTHVRCRAVWLSYVVVLLAFVVVPATAWADITITLKKTFIDQFKNRATIEAVYTVDQAHKAPNPPAKDADIHIAGRAPEIGLATVAEIMNAKGQPKALALIKNAIGGEPLHMVGAWRIWCEHGGDVEHVQGADLQPFNTTNPAHVFEIHPLTTVGQVDVTSGWKPIVGFKPKDAETAFLTYERTKSSITVGDDDTITIHTSMAGYNYVEFQIELSEDPVPIQDGFMVFASVRDLQGTELVHNRRMVFVAGTAPAKRVAGAKKGDVLHVLGLPRISLTLVDYRASHAHDKEYVGKDILNWNLPYEMIIAAVYPQ